MPTTTSKQKISLILTGILLTLIFLEIILRIGGLIFNLRQDWDNRQFASKPQDEYRILCIGESTTALGGEHSYPSLLQEILNQKGLKKNFRIINKGLVAKTSSDILAQLNDNLNRYKPDLVVAMIGVNDSHSLKDCPPWMIHTEAFFEKIRVYNFFKLLGMHVVHKFKEIRGEKVMTDLENKEGLNRDADHSPSSDRDLTKRIEKEEVNTQEINRQIKKFQVLIVQLENTLKENPKTPAALSIKKELKAAKLRLLWLRMYLGVYYRMKGDYAHAQHYFVTVVAQDPKNYSPYLELGRIYKELKNYKKALPFLIKANALMPDSNLVLLELGRCYNEIGRYQDTFKVFSLLFDKKPSEYWYYPEIGQWFKEHSFYPQAEAVFTKAIKKNPLDYYIYDQLSEVYKAQGKVDEAQSFRTQFESGQQQAHSYMRVTIYNYNKIVDAVLDRGIRMICMQYPRRDIPPLKSILNDKDKIIFVENKSNFDEALRNSQYSKYFSDNFGADFGHCTRLGNALIAENLAQVLLTSAKVMW